MEFTIFVLFSAYAVPLWIRDSKFMHNITWVSRTTDFIRLEHVILFTHFVVFVVARHFKSNMNRYDIRKKNHNIDGMHYIFLPKMVFPFFWRAKWTVKIVCINIDRKPFHLKTNRNVQLMLLIYFAFSRFCLSFVDHEQQK